MTDADVAIIFLVGLFGLTLVPRAHLGLAAFPAAFIVAEITGVPTEDLVSFFPSNFVILIVGVMLLFAVVEKTGAMMWVVDWVGALTAGRVLLIPLVPFVLGALLTAVGTLPLAALAITAPIGMRLAKEYRIPAFVMAFAILNGVVSGVFSPIAVQGLTINEQLDKLAVDMPAHTPAYLMVASLIVGCTTQAIVMLAYRRPLAALSREHRATGRITRSRDAEAQGSSNWPKVVSLLALVLLVVAAVGFDLDLGFTAFTLAFALLLILRLEPSDLISRVPWGVVVLIGGLLTYVGVMTSLDAFSRLSSLLSVGDSPVVGLLVVCYVAAITSFLANSIAVIVTTLPLLPPLIAQGVNPLGAVLACVLSAVLVDLNPLGSAGGMVLGATDPEDRRTTFQHLLVYGVCAVVLAPLALWAALGLW